MNARTCKTCRWGPRCTRIMGTCEGQEDFWEPIPIPSPLIGVDTPALREVVETLNQAREKIQAHLNEVYDSGGVEYIGLGSTLDRIDRTLALLRSESRVNGRHRIYVASSWKNDKQPGVVHALREAGHEVYDFRHPAEGDDGFSWSEIDQEWQSWTPEQYLAALDHPAARRGFGLDWSAMEWADTGVLVLPCGKSAHLEAGYFVGTRKRLYILMLNQDTPELMYKMATKVCTDGRSLIEALADTAEPREGERG